MVPAVLCVDVEPDLRKPAVPSPDEWPGFERILAALPGIREILGRTGSAAVNWFLRMDPQIEIAHGDRRWCAKRYGVEIDGLVAAGDELGLHPHSWRWDEPTSRWVSEHADEEWVRSVLDSSLSTFAEEFGSPCRIHRFGDRFMSPAIADGLSDAGVLVDLTLEPGLPATPGLVPTEASTGTIPYVPFERTVPFRPSRGTFLDVALAGGPGVTFAPLTTGLVPGRPAPETLVLWLAPPVFARALRLRMLDPDLRHLAFAVRSEAATLSEAWANVLANLNHLADEVPSIRWVGASSLASLATSDAGAGRVGPLGAVAAELDAVASSLDGVGDEGDGSVAGRAAWLRAAYDSAVHARNLSAAHGDALAAALEASAAVRGELRAALSGTEARAQALEATVADIEVTVTWRARRRLLLLARLLARRRRSR